MRLILTYPGGHKVVYKGFTLIEFHQIVSRTILDIKDFEPVGFEINQWLLGSTSTSRGSKVWYDSTTHLQNERSHTPH